MLKIDPSNLKTLDWQKQNGLIPAIVQDAKTQLVLMLGYMNLEALKKTLESKKVTFYSRTKKRLWTKGESSKNYLCLEEIGTDCDRDTLLVQVQPMGPCCHLDKTSCFQTPTRTDNFEFIAKLEKIINLRVEQKNEESYSYSQFKRGPKRLAQKVGEEGVEVALAAVADTKEAYLEETADLLYHLLLLNKSKEVSLTDIIQVLEKRHK